MSYKVISTLLSGDNGKTSAVEAAIALADLHEAHLDFHAIGYDRTDPGFYYAGANALVLESSIKEAVAQKDAAETYLTERMSGEVVPWSTTGAILRQSGMQRYLALNLRFSDLVVLRRPYQDAENNDDGAIAEAVLFEAERPVLMLPDDAKPPSLGGRIVLGWNDGAEALSAARAALPFLKRASQVDVCIIDPPRHGEHRSDPGGLLAQYLVRHGVKSQVAVLARTEDSIGNILMRHATEIGAEMIVAGAYGHSRLREAVFGGTSRDMLGRCQMPLFMAR